MGLDSTTHCHRFTPNTSSGTCTFMSCFTGAWHDNRQPSAASRRVKCPSSVGSMEPPPSLITHLHWAQLPPPPQADGKNNPAADSVCNNLSPAGTVIVFSPFISMLTLPDDTNLLRATKIKATNARITVVNIPTPRIISN